MTRRAVGADGCRDGWVVVALEDGVVAEVEVVERLDEVLATPAGAVAVDMPVGLVDGVREADAAARAMLPGRASSVFSTPPRVVVDGWRDGRLATHAAASVAAREAAGFGISQQAWRLVPKIAHVDDLVVAGHPIFEVHPEVAFCVVVGEPLPRKRSWAGITTRRAVLHHLGVEVPDRFVGDVSTAPDDVLDAAICAWVADAIAAGTPVLRLPQEPAQHARGRPVAMYARPLGDGGVGVLPRS